MINLNATDKQTLTKEMVKLIEFFNELEQKLQYPMCEGNADQIRTLFSAERELMLWGKI